MVGRVMMMMMRMVMRGTSGVSRGGARGGDRSWWYDRTQNHDDVGNDGWIWDDSKRSWSWESATSPADTMRDSPETPSPAVEVRTPNAEISQFLAARKPSDMLEQSDQVSNRSAAPEAAHVAEGPERFQSTHPNTTC